MGGWWSFESEQLLGLLIVDEKEGTTQQSAGPHLWLSELSGEHSRLTTCLTGLTGSDSHPTLALYHVCLPGMHANEHQHSALALEEDLDIPSRHRSLSLHSILEEGICQR